ncbi:MAG: Crp/Fnr family transcriptional regulator [Xanthobacteraceae bacterium]|uniref:Crp/Fnr family transcriptional regulator n=1 Tax=Pseudolabrys sp. TaxID=1960880 RepID=UPI003D0C31B6
MERQAEFDLQILARTELFRGADNRILIEARDAAFKKRLAAGDVLFSQGDPTSATYIVVVGRLRATQTTADGQQIIIRYLGPGEFVGFMALSSGANHPGSAIAVEETHLMGWSAGTIRTLMEKHSSIALNALAALGTRYHEMQIRLREIATERVEQRIAHAILRLAKHAGRTTPNGIEISIPLSRQDLAEMSGTTLHTVSRVLSAWESVGLVDTGRRRVMVRKSDALEGIAAAAPA